jgi:hypothetical protein
VIKPVRNLRAMSSRLAVIHYLGYLLLLSDAVYGGSVQNFHLPAVNVPIFGSQKNVEQGNILPSWVPVRHASTADTGLTEANESEVWPSLLSNLWQKTEIALFVSPLSLSGSMSKATSIKCPANDIPKIPSQFTFASHSKSIFHQLRNAQAP